MLFCMVLAESIVSLHKRKKLVCRPSPYLQFHMSALSILYLVLPFPLAFLLHDTEEAIVQHRWMLKHKDALAARFPGMRHLIGYLSRISTKAFVVAALEELLVLLLATCYVLVQGAYGLQIWSALFMAFSFHLLVHGLQAIMVKGYVPGLVSSLLLLPYCYLGLESIGYAMGGMEMLLWGVAGILFMAVNLWFAHRMAGWVERALHAVKGQTGV